MSNKILIIEDHDKIRANIVEILELALYTVFEADNGKIGVEMALTHIPDLILCDIMMPELDGYGVLYLLNKHIETIGIPFIFLTAKAEHGDLRKGMELGADDYLIKPFDGMELLNAIDTKLRKKVTQDNIHLANEQLKVLVNKTDGIVEFKQIISEQKIKEFKKNRTIFDEGEHGKGLYLIISGKIKTIKLAEDGRELMTGMYSAGDYIGINAVLSKSSYTDTATAIEDSQLCLIPIELLDNMLAIYPELSRKFLSLLSINNQEKEEQLLQLAYHSVRKKMANTLVKLHLHRNENQTDFNVSREDLAAMSCMATETVSRTLSDFKDEKLISRIGTKITVLNFDGLSNMKN